MRSNSEKNAAEDAKVTTKGCNTVGQVYVVRGIMHRVDITKKKLFSETISIWSGI